MKFRTELPPLKILPQIDHRKQLVSLGSCFSDEIGARLKEHLFPTAQNPFGVLYNPRSVANAILLGMEKIKVTDDDLVEQGGVYHSFYHHSSHSALSEAGLRENISQSITATAEALKQADVLYLTLGTAWVYQWKKTGRVVANNHKLPDELFTRRRMEVDEMVDTLGDTLEQLRTLNPEVQVVLTISPVRHLKDGFQGNQVSKALLVLAADALRKKYEYVHYYPAYEIVLDDLRDYRFYADDLTHPAKAAVDYIWQHFGESCFTDNAKLLNQLIRAINSGLNHRPFHPESAQHQQFLNGLEQRIAQVKSQHPYLNTTNWEERLTALRKQ